MADKAHGWKLADRIAWLRTYGPTLSPIQPKPKLGVLFNMEPEAELPMIHHLAFKLMQAMFCRLNWKPMTRK